MLDKQKTKPSFIGLAGNIGVGKTTFTKLLSEKLINKICKKYKVPHKKLPKAQIKPYLKCPTNKSL